MSGDWLARERALIGGEALERLAASRVLLFGVGGVGGGALEALVRAGVGHITCVDSDTVDPTNLNRQLIALSENMGAPKTAAAQARALSINPDIDFRAVQAFADAENIPGIIDDAAPDYIIDAIDCVSSKLAIAARAQTLGIPLISCMGTGNKLDPGRFRIDDISKTNTCPLCRVMRRETQRLGIARLRVLWSDEPPVHTGSRTPASISFVPPAAGMMLAGYCIRELIGL